MVSLEKIIDVKKGILFLISFVFFSNVINSQEAGLRFGEMAGNNIAIDGVYNFKDSRIHGDISFGEGVGIDVVYDFVLNPITGVDNLYYYLGIGITTLIQSDYELGGVGEVGIEYRFPNIPLTLSLDYRPAIIVIEKSDFHWNGFGLNLRYVIYDDFN